MHVCRGRRIRPRFRCSYRINRHGHRSRDCGELPGRTFPPVVTSGLDASRYAFEMSPRAAGQGPLGGHWHLEDRERRRNAAAVHARVPRGAPAPDWPTPPVAPDGPDRAVRHRWKAADAKRDRPGGRRSAARIKGMSLVGTQGGEQPPVAARSPLLPLRRPARARADGERPPLAARRCRREQPSAARVNPAALMSSPIRDRSSREPLRESVWSTRGGARRRRCWHDDAERTRPPACGEIMPGDAITRPPLWMGARRP